MAGDSPGCGRGESSSVQLGGNVDWEEVPTGRLRGVKCARQNQTFDKEKIVDVSQKLW